MKLKITIAGAKVHDVGYRVFLMKNAMNEALPGLSTYYSKENDKQQVITLIEGDDARVEAFKKRILESKPALAEVEDIAFESYSGEVSRIGEAIIICTFLLLERAASVLCPTEKKHYVKI